MRISLLFQTGQSYFVPVERAPGKLSPSILAGITSAPNQMLFLPPTSLCYLCIFCSVLSFSFFLSAASSSPRWLWMCLLPEAHSFLSALYLFCHWCSLFLTAVERWHSGGVTLVLGLSPPSATVTLQWSSAQEKKCFGMCVLIAFLFQEAFLLVRAEKFIHQMIGVRPTMAKKKDGWWISSSFHWTKMKPKYL